MTTQGKPDRCPVAVYECPWHGRGHDWKCDECHVVGHDSSPVPAAAMLDDFSPEDRNKASDAMDIAQSAPQAESVPSGKDEALAGYLDQIGLKHTRKCVPFVINYLCMRCRVEVAAKAFLTSQTAALAAERDQQSECADAWMKQYVKAQAELTESINDHVYTTGRVLALEREARSSRTRLEAAERSNSLLRERVTAAEGLLKIISDPPHDCCGCEDHSKANADCCAYVNYHCPECIAGAYFEKENQ